MARKPSSTAIHEAAHAVVAYILGYKVMEIHVDDDKGMGYCVVMLRSPRREECPITKCLILLAAREAEILWCGRDAGRMSWGDLRAMKKLGLSWTGINTLVPGLKVFLRQWKSSIWDVARMADAGDVSGRKFHAYMKTRCEYRPKLPKMCR